MNSSLNRCRQERKTGNRKMVKREFPQETNPGFPAVPQKNFPWLLVKNLPFFPDKNAEKGQFFPDSRWKWTFFPWSKRGFFCICNKIFFPAFKQHYYQLYISQCADFSDYNDYLEDPPWLGPTRKFLKIGNQRLAESHKF